MELKGCCETEEHLLAPLQVCSVNEHVNVCEKARRPQSFPAVQGQREVREVLATQALPGYYGGCSSTS